MLSTRNKRKVPNLTVDDANALLCTLAELQEQFDEEDEDLPTGLISGLQQLRKKLEVIPARCPFDALTLLQVKIKSGPLLLSPDVMSDIKSLGVNMRMAELSMETLTEAGCRILINMILLRVVSAMSTDETDMNIIPEFPIAKTTFPSNLSSRGVVDLLLTKLPSRFAREIMIFSCDLAGFLTFSQAISFSTRPKRDNVRAAIPQAVMAAASHCMQHGIPVLRGCTTSGEQYSVNDGGGGRVACSDEFSLGQQLEGPPLILGLLTDWVDNATAYDQKFFTYK
ncbi:hypothetical protein BYT27DRAFT_7258695 [Phlegmacium glaucopus]|nr:hypothetical protein BYT27DRAFT_7258695 [Phlegmacium glaucopus]